MKTKSESALDFILSNIDLGRTIYINTCLKSTKITPSNFKKWKQRGDVMFKINQRGDLLMASGKNFNIICHKDLSLVKIYAQ